MSDALTKQAIVLEDSLSAITPLVDALNVFAGVDVSLFGSIPAFQRFFNLTDGADRNRYLQALADVLKTFSVIVCDNNFDQHGDKDHPYDSEIKGIDFLISDVGPALNLMAPEDRPTVVCFAPSNYEAIEQSRQELESMGIVAFQKEQQASFVGLFTAMVKEYGPMTYAEFMGILGITEEDMGYDGKGYDLNYDLRSEFLLEKKILFNEESKKFESPARPTTWQVLKEYTVTKLEIDNDLFDSRVSEIQSRHIREGNQPGFTR